MAVPPPPSNAGRPDGDKAGLRARLRRERLRFVDDLGPSARAARLQAIESRLLPLLSRAGPIAGYVAHGGEPDILPFLLRAHHAGHAVALPHVSQGNMTFRRWSPDAPLTPGLAGIPQPDAGEPIDPVLLLVPLVGFDRRGHRLGQGGGFYDRWLDRHPAAMRIGVAWSVQEVTALDPEAWDMPLHAIATEKEWIEP